MVWDAALTFAPADKADILALARAMGIPNPQRVIFDRYYSSETCTQVSVESDVVDGNQVRTSILRIVRPGNDPVRCQPAALHRRGKWLVTPANATRERVRWRIQDPAGTVDRP
jgi:hypothetical protein